METNNKREILFRGKRIDNGEWVEGYFIRRDGKCRIYPITYNSVYKYHLVSEETVGQFTGLLDKNGTKIFEGQDIINGNGARFTIYYGQCTWMCLGVSRPYRPLNDLQYVITEKYEVVPD